MPRILCYGDSNTWGYAPRPEPPSTRHPRDSRWPCVMASALGGNVELIEEGLNARTTDVADPTQPLGGAGLDGAAYLPACLASHLPLDLVVIMLGTNDLKAMFARPPLRIALGAAKLVEIACSIAGGVGTAYSSPQVLLVCPPPLGRLDILAALFEGGAEKSRALPPLYARAAAFGGASFLDAGKVIATDGEDGIHLTADAQRRLGLAVAEAVRTAAAP